MTFTWYESLHTPPWWDRLTWLLLGATAVLGVGAAAGFVLESPLTPGPGPGPAAAFPLLYLLLMIGYAVWRSGTRRLADRYGDQRAADGLPAGLARMSPVPLVTLIWFRPADEIGGPAAVLFGRIAALTLLAVAVVLIRFRLRALVADQAAQIDAAVQARSLGLPYPSAPARAPRPVEPHAARPADDRFWAEVAGRAAAAGGDLALLEWLDDRTGRWHLVGADPAPVRAALPAGAVVVVYPDPPHPPGAATGQRVPDLRRSLVGLILLPDGPRFERLWSADELDWWLPRAQAADRVGLYPVDPADRPGCLVASVPPPDTTGSGLVGGPPPGMAR